MNTLFRRARNLIFSPPSPPRAFQNDNFKLLDPNKPIEEEKLWCYDQLIFYPAHIGEVVSSRYQILGKLGWGAYSTIWLARDLQCVLQTTFPTGC